jgi:hypothetical protein
MLTEERVDAIFKEMDSYVLELAHEPGMLGPQYFQDIIAKCRGYLNKASLVVSELNREKLETSSELRKLEAVYSLEYDNLLANDLHVKQLANIEDRKSTVGFRLRQERREINELKDRLHAVDSVYKVVTHRNRELHATMNAIKDQRRLMVTELSTGAFYGDERVPRHLRQVSEPTGNMMLDDITEEDITSLLDEPTPEPRVGVQEPDLVKEPVVQEKVSTDAAPENVVESKGASEEEVLKFIEGGDPTAVQSVVSKPSNEEDDLLSLLDSL